jgi:hypothetical protein
MKRYLLLPGIIGMICCSNGNSSAQAISNTSVERTANAERFARINYENDFFTATDYYYTQGVHLEFVYPGMGRFFTSKLLVHPENYNTRFGLALQHNVYTPVDYVATDIQYGDRPFAADALLQFFSIANNQDKRQRINTALTIGVMGPWAGAKELQTYIHEITPNAVPKGWDNQLHNDAVLNYQLQFDKQLWELRRYINVSANVMARAGTLSDKASAGITVMFGLINNPFGAYSDEHRKFQLYFYDHPEISGVVYDATMQGGMFDRSNPYTIPADAISRGVFRNNWGIVLQYGNLYLEYYQSYITKEFNSGLDHHNGGIQIGVGL